MSNTDANKIFKKLYGRTYDQLKFAGKNTKKHDEDFTTAQRIVKKSKSLTDVMKAGPKKK